MEKIENKIERLEIKIDLLIDMVAEVTLPKYYYASDKTQPINTQPQTEEIKGYASGRTGPTGDKPQDTPEEWREVNKDIWYMVGGKKYVNINGEEYVRTSDLEQLLEEREDKAREEGIRDGLRGKVFSKVEITEEAHIPKELLEKIREEGIEEVYKKFCEWEIPKNLSKEQKETFDDLLGELSKLNK